MGLYNDTLPIQIAVTAELKSEHRLEQIGEVAEQILTRIIEENDRQVEGNFMTAFVGFCEDANVAKKKAEKISGQEEIEKARADFKKALEKIKRKALMLDYSFTWKKYEERYTNNSIEQA